MKYSIKQKVKRWREIHITAKEFFKLPEAPFDDYKITSDVTLVFTDGVTTNDESFYYKDGRVRISSFHSGLTQWSDKLGCYVHLYYGSERPIGRLVRLEFPYSRKLENLLKKHSK